MNISFWEEQIFGDNPQLVMMSLAILVAILDVSHIPNIHEGDTKQKLNNIKFGSIFNLNMLFRILVRRFYESHYKNYVSGLHGCIILNIGIPQY